MMSKQAGEKQSDKKQSVRKIIRKEFNLKVAPWAYRFDDVTFVATDPIPNPNNTSEILIGVYAKNKKDLIARLFQETRFKMLMTQQDGSKEFLSAVRYDGQEISCVKNDPISSTLAIFKMPFDAFSNAQSITLQVRTNERCRQSDIAVVEPMPTKTKTPQPKCS